MRKHTCLIAMGLLFLVALYASAQDEKIDMATIQKIREEGLQHSHVMDIAFHLTDASGNRLTASPGFMRAANWAKQQLTDWGLAGATLDPWGEFRQRLGAAKVLCRPHRPLLQAADRLPKSLVRRHQRPEIGLRPADHRHRFRRSRPI